jgi:hypothetical protein
MQFWLLIKSLKKILRSQLCVLILCRVWGCRLFPPFPGYLCTSRKRPAWDSKRPCFLPVSCSFLAWVTFQTWRWRRHVPSNHLLTCNGLHGVITRNIKILSRHIPGGTEENGEKSGDNRSLGRDLSVRFRKHDAGLPTSQTRKSRKMFFLH